MNENHKNKYMKMCRVCDVFTNSIPLNDKCNEIGNISRFKHNANKSVEFNFICILHSKREFFFCS